MPLGRVWFGTALASSVESQVDVGDNWGLFTAQSEAVDDEVIDHCWCRFAV